MTDCEAGVWLVRWGAHPQAQAQSGLGRVSSVVGTGGGARGSGAEELIFATASNGARVERGSYAGAGVRRFGCWKTKDRGVAGLLGLLLGVERESESEECQGVGGEAAQNRRDRRWAGLVAREPCTTNQHHDPDKQQAANGGQRGRSKGKSSSRLSRVWE